MKTVIKYRRGVFLLNFNSVIGSIVTRKKVSLEMRGKTVHDPFDYAFTRAKTSQPAQYFVNKLHTREHQPNLTVQRLAQQSKDLVLPGENCSVFGCSTSRKHKRVSIWKLPVPKTNSIRNGGVISLMLLQKTE